MTERQSPDLCVVAVQSRDFKLLKKAHANGTQLTLDCSTYAAFNDQLEILVYLIENNCPWDKTTYVLAGPLCRKYLSTLFDVTSLFEKEYTEACSRLSSK
jgi:hypothetical protein